MSLKVIGEYTFYRGAWFYVPDGFWERRRLATATEVATLEAG